MFPKEDEIECSEKHIHQTKRDIKRPNIYSGLFFPQRSLNFSNTGVFYIDIFLNTEGSSFNNSFITMRAYDSGKFFIKKTTITNLHNAFFTILVMAINNNNK